MRYAGNYIIIKRDYYRSNSKRLYNPTAVRQPKAEKACNCHSGNIVNDSGGGELEFQL